MVKRVWRLCFFILLICPFSAAAEEPILEGHKGLYLVKSNNVNVRAKPSTNGKKLSKLQKRDIVISNGYIKGTNWLFVSEGDQKLGYVFARSLTPLIDGTLKKPIKGSFSFSAPQEINCSYDITYEGRAIEEETLFISADYQTQINCRSANININLDATTFMSEVPFDLRQKRIYQITLNLPEIAAGYEEFVSATSLYNQEKSIVKMHHLAPKNLKVKKLPEPKPAKNIEEALRQALIMQLQSFNEKGWKVLSGDIEPANTLKPD
jgi:hypothetical protein